jgi:hypothetical protein
VLPWKKAVRAKTTAALAANTYANGSSGVGATLTGNANGALAAQDGVTLVANDRLLVANESTGSRNGIYTVTQVGSAGTPYILTRATDADTGAKLVNATCKVSEGPVAADQEWQCTTNATITVGTTTLTWAQAGGSAAITIKDEGTAVTSAPVSINFAGAGATASDDGAGNVTVNVPGVAGITGGALTLISEQVLAADGVPADFTSIPATYRDLVLVVRGRGSAAATEARLQLQFNGDTAANYDWKDVGVSTGVFQGSNFANTSAGAAMIVADTSPAGTSSLAEIHIGDYRGTAFHKSFVGSNGEKTSNSASAANMIQRFHQGVWRSTAAINQISVLTSCKAGSVLSLYGRS